MLWYLAFQTIHDRLLHTRAPVNFGFLGGVLVDNRTHFLHHTRTEARSGKNFASTFTILDRLFGTWERPETGALTATGIDGQGRHAALGAFFLARLDGKPPAEPVAPRSAPRRPPAPCARTRRLDPIGIAALAALHPRRREPAAALLLLAPFLA